MGALTGDRWRYLSPYLDRALEMAVDERVAWLAALRSEDPEVADDLQTLLEERDAIDRNGFLAGSAASVSGEPSLAGHTVGAYTLASPIGQGGMGSVWLAERSDGRFAGRAAVKFLNVALIGRAGEERFKREGSILARLTHANIAHLVDAGVSSLGQPYLVLEHVEGEHIDQYCDRRTLAIEARVRLFLEVLDAVAHAHANLIVHRDIKPSNVLVRTDGQVKLLDFGIAKLLESETQAAGSTLTVEGGRALTPEYAAPEQMTGGPITTATDVHALGVLLYVLLCGQHPTEAASGSPAELIKAIVDTEAPRASDVTGARTASAPGRMTEIAARRGTTPDRLRRMLRGDLDNIIAKALKKRPEERYTSVGAFAGDLRHYLNHEPVGARPDTVAYRTAKFARRHTRGLAAAATVTLLVAGLVGFYTVRLAEERDRARLEADKTAKISELLTGLLTGADPYTTRETPEPTVRALLDAGAARVQKELAGQPELQAEMLTVIGRVYQRLGAHDKAQPLLEEALAIGRRIGGPEHARLAQSLNDLGVLRRERGDYAAAEPLLAEALAMRRRLLGPEHKEVAVTLVELGRVYLSRGSSDRAEPLFREALAIRRKVLGEAHRETATSKSDLALLLWQKGDLSTAESLFREALATDRKVLGDDHLNVAIDLNNLALVLQDRGDYAGAESLFREALAIRRKIFGEKHPSLAVMLNNLAQPLRERGKYDEAALLLQEALELARPALGDDHPNVASFMANLAQVQLARGDAAAAEPLIRHALRTRQRIYQGDDWRIGMTKSLLGECLTALGRYGEAEPLLLDAQRVIKETPGRQGREARTTRARLVTLYEAWGRPEKAAAYRTVQR